MNRLPDCIRRHIGDMLRVVDCVHFQVACGVTLFTTQELMQRAEVEPLTNTFRMFKHGKLRTYKIYSYIRNGVTYSDVSVSPMCQTFVCIHKYLVTPSVASHWILSCIYDGTDVGRGKIIYETIT